MTLDKWAPLAAAASQSPAKGKSSPTGKYGLCWLGWKQPNFLGRVD